MKPLPKHVICLMAVFLAATLGSEARQMSPDQKPELVSYTVTGRVYASDTFHEKPYPLQGASVQIILNTDKEYKAPVRTTDKDGKFFAYAATLEGVKSYNIQLRVSYVGMITREETVKVKLRDSKDGLMFSASIDSIVLQSNPVTLEEVQIMGELKKVYMRGDTTVFNVGAYKMPEGSMLLELVRRLPGLRYNDNKLTYNGRSIDEMRLNGDTFFKHDINIALKNMTNSSLRTVEIYEAKPDSTDAERKKKLVMDMKTKKKTSRVNLGNIEAGIADKDNNYLLSGSASFWKAKGPQLSIKGEMKDMPDIDDQLYTRQNYKNADVYYTQPFGKVTLSSQYTHKYYLHVGEGTDKTWQSYDDATRESVGNFAERSSMRDHNGRFGLVFKPNRQTILNFSFYVGDHQNSNSSVNETTESLNDVALNRSSMASTSHGHSKSGGGMLNFFRFLKKQDVLNTTLSFMVSNTHQSSDVNREIDFLTLGDSLTRYHRYTSEPQRDCHFTLRQNYSHRFGKRNTWSISYMLAADNGRSDRDVNDLLAPATALIDTMSYHKTNDKLTNELTNELNLEWEKFSSSFKFNLSAVHNKLTYLRRDGLPASSKHDWLLFNASAGLTYKYSKRSKTTLSYSIKRNMPGNDYLLEVADYIDPMSITTGNDHLGSYIDNTFSLSGNARSLIYSLSYTRTNNAIVIKSHYDPTTGVSVRRPENASGNYQLRANLRYMKMLGNFTLNATGNYLFRHTLVGTSQMGTDDNVNNYANSHNVRLEGRLQYANSFCSQALELGYLYNLVRRKTSILDNTRITYNTGLLSQFHLPWALVLDSYINWESRHGSMASPGEKTDLVVWKLALSRRFLKSKMLTVKVSTNDLLHQRQNYRVNYLSNGWSENRQDGDSHYFMFSLIWHFNKM